MNCPLCNGAPAKNCLCGGTGTINAAFARLSEMYFKEKNQREEIEASLSELQQAVLGFIFDPRFKHLDKGSYFRRYWQDKLKCTIEFVSPKVEVNISGKVFK